MPKTQKPHAPGVAAQPEEQADCSAQTARSASASTAASGDISEAETPKSILPEVSLEHTDPGEDTRTRRGVLQSKRLLESQRADAFAETRGMGASEEKNALYKEIQACTAQAGHLERHLNSRFVPQHGPEQFLSPRAFFVSPLFRVRSKTRLREKHLELDLQTPNGKPSIRYVGPELRQSDGLVFLSLVHMLRDVQVGTAVSLQPEAVCRALFGRYDGNSRRQLREHIQRLQQGLLIFDTHSVQMCLRFDYPKTGRWTPATNARSKKQTGAPRNERPGQPLDAFGRLVRIQQTFLPRLHFLQAWHRFSLQQLCHNTHLHKRPPQIPVVLLLLGFVNAPLQALQHPGQAFSRSKASWLFSSVAVSSLIISGCMQAMARA